MGSPLSPVLANLFKEFFETELLPTLPIQPPFWARYVDDVIIFWPDELDFQDFFNRVNALVPTINFTTEWEREGVLPFLDMKVHRLTSGFDFAIYRKPTHSNQYIHYFSCQPEHVKRGSVFSLLLRAYRLCGQLHLKEEIDFVFRSFMDVGFPKYILYEVHSKVKTKFFRKPIERREDMEPEPSDGDRKPTISLPHNNFITQYAKPVFAANNFQVVNKAQNTLHKALVHNRPPQRMVDSASPGVYRVPCLDCSENYYGETGRGLSIRLNEHKNAVSRKDQNNAFFRHQKDTFAKSGREHSINWDGAKLIHKNSNWYNRLIVESSLIKTSENFNGMKSTLGIDSYSAKMVVNSLPNLTS